MSKQEYTEFYDVSRKQREVADWRYARKVQLRTEYLKQALNPVNQILPRDDAMMFMTQTRIQHEFTTHLKFKPHVVAAICIITFVVTNAKNLKRIKYNRETHFGRGTVSYVDIQSKFL